MSFLQTPKETACSKKLHWSRTSVIYFGFYFVKQQTEKYCVILITPERSQSVLSFGPKLLGLGACSHCSGYDRRVCPAPSRHVRLEHFGSGHRRCRAFHSLQEVQAGRQDLLYSITAPSLSLGAKELRGIRRGVRIKSSSRTRR